MSSTELKWVAVDVDGTLFENNWSIDNPHAGLGKPIWPNIKKMYELWEAGYKIVLHTARPWADHSAIEKAMSDHCIPYKAIVCGKLLAAAYIDDRAVAANHPDWLAAVKEITGE